MASKSFEQLKCLLGGFVVADNNFRGVETHVDKGGSLGHELTANREDQVGAVTAFVFLHFGGLSDHLGGRVVHIRFLDDGVSVRGDKELLQVVDDHLVHACKKSGVNIPERVSLFTYLQVRGQCVSS